jgi:hypothetical protein
MRNNGRLQHLGPVDGFVWCKLLPLNACNLLIGDCKFWYRNHCNVGWNFCNIDLINCVYDCIVTNSCWAEI